jgi:hypothetical protein
VVAIFANELKTRVKGKHNTNNEEKKKEKASILCDRADHECPGDWALEVDLLRGFDKHAIALLVAGHQLVRVVHVPCLNHVNQRQEQRNKEY